MAGTKVQCFVIPDKLYLHHALLPSVNPLQSPNLYHLIIAISGGLFLKETHPISAVLTAEWRTGFQIPLLWVESRLRAEVSSTCLVPPALPLLVPLVISLKDCSYRM